MANTDKELAQLAAEEKKLIEQQKAERDALKKDSLRSRNRSARKSATE